MLTNLLIFLLASCCAFAARGDNSKDDWSNCGCQNDGTCAKLKNGVWTCLCPSGYNGGSCENKIDYCEGNPCGDHGVCTESGNSYQCSCENGYGGEPCQLANDEPTGDSCSNNLDCSVKVQGSLCEGGTCYCPFNHKYVTDSTPTSTDPLNRRLCLRECPNGYKLADKFIPFPTKRTIVYENDRTVTDISLADCKQLCLNANLGGFRCRSLEFVRDKTCRLNILSVSDYGVTIADRSDKPFNVESFERPCEKET